MEFSQWMNLKILPERRQWLMLVILATQEADIRKIVVRSSLGK
jgi:hypothetical protein